MAKSFRAYPTATITAHMTMIASGLYSPLSLSSTAWRTKETSSSSFRVTSGSMGSSPRAATWALLG